MRTAPDTRLRKWRLANGLTQRELCDLVGLNTALLSQAERDIRALTWRNKIAIARVLHVPVRELFEPVPLPAATPDEESAQTEVNDGVATL